MTRREQLSALRPYLLAAVVVAALMLVLFAIVEAVDVPLLTDEEPALGPSGVGAAITSVVLLVIDVVLPVPSSGVMVVNGVLFGAFFGALLSLVGSLGAATLGWWLGRRGERAVTSAAVRRDRTRGATLIAEHGALAVVVSRPVPVLAETVAIMAGAAGMPLRRLVVAALLGSLPPAVGYAVAGAAALRAGVTVPVFAAVLVVSALLWAVGLTRSVRRERDRPTVAAPLKPLGTNAREGD